MSDGCGNAHFYPNTTGTYSYDANTPDPTVLTSCENYGLHNGPDGKDLTTTYNNAMTDTLYGRSPSLTAPAPPRISPPATTTAAATARRTSIRTSLARARRRKTKTEPPMQNWWVYLFY